MKRHYRYTSLSALAATVLLLLGLPNLAQAATSISQYGITWTWQEDRQTGQFANGDYWVVGPITLTSISPASIVTDSAGASGMTAHGSMINPIAGWWTNQGLDSRIMKYNEALNIARQGGRPLSASNTRVVATGSSICSSTSRLTAGAGEHSLLNDFAVLTVLASAPASGSFRPPYIGTDKTVRWNKSSLDYSILKNLTPASGMSSPTSSQFTRPWVHISIEYNIARDYSAVNNQKEYDRDIDWELATAILELHQNYSNAAKELAYVRLVQYGIDVYGAVKYGQHVEGGKTYALSHGNSGPKAAVVLAGLALNDTDIKFYADASNKVTDPWSGAGFNRWMCDQTIRYVAAGDVSRAVSNEISIGRPRYTYTSQMVGLPEWDLGGSNWGNIYRDIRYSGMVGIALALQLTTGGKALANWPAYFDYFDRAFSIYSNSSSDPTWPGFVNAWWGSYRVSQGATGWTKPAPFSGIGWIPANGTTLTIEYTDNVTTGAGGNGGLTISASGGAVTATYKSGNGTTQRVYNLSRTIGSGETATYTYNQPGNGVEAKTGGADVPNISSVQIVNYSSVAGGSASSSTAPSNATITISVQP